MKSLLRLLVMVVIFATRNATASIMLGGSLADPQVADARITKHAGFL